MPNHSETLVQFALAAIEELKAEDIQVLDVRTLTDMTDFMIIASGRSTRQVAAIAEHLVEQAKKAGYQPLGVEGLPAGDWVLVDLADVVVHVMEPETRLFYQLEKLWDSGAKAGGAADIPP